MKKNKKSGIILITTLIFMTLTFMLAVMICKNGKESLYAGNRYADNEQAYLAAVSGIEYIKGQLYANKNWEVNAPSKASNKKNGILIEKEGNTLTGYILTDASGTVSNTNYDSKFEIYSVNNTNNREYKTINNLSNSNIIYPVVANTPTGNSNPNGSRREIPPKTFYAYVKGTCGKTVRYAEALLISNGPKALDGGNVINGTVKITSKSNENYNGNPFIIIDNVSNNKNGKITASDELIFSANGTNNPRMILNPKNNINIVSNGAEIGTFQREGINKPQLKGMVINNGSDHIIYNQNDLINEAVQNLPYNNETTNVTNLNSGTYVFVIEENQKDNTLKKYWRYSSKDEINETNIKDIKKQCKKDQLKAIPDNIKENSNISFNNRTVNVKGNISCNGNLNLIVINKVIKNNGKCNCNVSTNDTIDFSIGQAGTITTNGNFYVNGEITGTGKIYCSGNLTMNAGSELETIPQTGVAIYANDNIIVKEAKNLSLNSEEKEKEIIDKALDEAKEKGITLVSSPSDSTSDDDDIDDSDTTTDSELNTDSTKTDTTGSTSASTNTNIDEETPLVPTEVIINGHTYDVTQKIPNAQPQEDILDKNAIIISCSFDGHNYRLKLKQDSISVYKDGVKYPHDITTEDIMTRYHNHDDQNDRCIHVNDIQTGGYPSDRILKIDHHALGILDIVGRDGKTAKTYSKKYQHQNGTYIFSQYDYLGNLRTASDCTDFSIDTVTSISEKESTTSNTDASTSETDENKQEEVTIQSYVNKYYKENVGKTSIRGSIYSKEGNININGDEKDFNLIGALITGSGNLIISNVSHVNLKYDPNYVPFFEEQGILTTTIFESTF